MKKILPILYTLYSILYTFVPSANAQSANFSVSPPVVELLLAPNSTVTQTFIIKNDGADAAYSLSFHKVIPTDDLGHSTIDPAPYSFVNAPVSAKLIGKDSDTLYPFPAGKTEAIQVELSSATVDEAVDQYFALVVSLQNPTDLSGVTKLSSQIAALILTTTTPVPAIPTDITIEDFNPPRVHDSLFPLQISPRLVNNAPVMLRVKGKLELTSPNNKLLETINIDPILVLSDTSRQLPQLSLTTNISPLFSRIGPHSLKLTIQTDGGRTLIESEKVFWFLPLRLMIIITALILIKIAWKIHTFRSLTNADKKAHS